MESNPALIRFPSALRSAGILRLLHTSLHEVGVGGSHFNP